MTDPLADSFSLDQTIVFVGGGLEALPGIRLARELGLRVAVTDGSPEAPGLALAHEPVLASTYDPAGTVAALEPVARRLGGLSGVLCMATDTPHTVAAVAQAFGLVGPSPETAALAMDKLAMKERFAADGVPVPWFAPVPEAEALLGIMRQEGPPLVLKPVDSRGARGVLLLRGGETPDRLRAAYAEALAHSPTGRVMVERFLDGPQISTESLVVRGVCRTPGFSDRNYALLERFAPHIIEDGGELPSFLPPEVQDAVRDLAARAARSLGIVNGVAKGDLVVHQGRPYVIEMAARLSGGYFCSHEIPLNTGVDFVGCAIRVALGRPLEEDALTPRFQRGVGQRYIFPRPGVVEAVLGEAEARALPGVALCELRVKPGDLVAPIHSHPARAGVVIAVGETRAQAVERAQAAVATITVRTRAV